MEVSTAANLNVNLNRVSANSRTFSKNEQNVQKTATKPTREMPAVNKEKEGFVTVEGKNLKLGAPRGTYVDLVV